MRMSVDSIRIIRKSDESKGVEIQKVWLPGDHYSIIDVASDDWLTQIETITDWL